MPRSGRTTIAAAVLAIGFALGRLVAAAPAGDSPAAAIADGQPWIMQTADGAELQLTLHGDGTGRIEGGPVSLAPKWRATPDGLCLKPGLLVSERCLVLQREADGYVARRDGEIVFRLTR